jgi:hypothetical protein
MATWTAAILAGLAVVWAGARVYGTLRETRKILDGMYPHEPSTGAPRRYGEELMSHLGGPNEAARKVTFYRRFGWLLPRNDLGLSRAQYEEEDTRNCHFVLRECGPAGLPPLIRELKSKNPYARELAAYGLGCSGKDVSSNAVAALAEALNDPVVPVRLACVQALGELGPRAKSVLPALERLRTEPRQRDDLIAIEEAIKKIRGDEKP